MQAARHDDDDIYASFSIKYAVDKIFNDDDDDKSISIPVAQKKLMPVWCEKKGVSLKTDIIMITYKVLILYLTVWVYKMKPPFHRLHQIAFKIQVNKSLREIIKTSILQCLYKNHNKH